MGVLLIFHRCRAIGRWEEGRRVYYLTRTLFPNVLPVTVEIMDRARELMDRDGTILAGDALHAAVVITQGLGGVCSFDPNAVRRSRIATEKLPGPLPLGLPVRCQLQDGLRDQPPPYFVLQRAGLKGG